MSWTRTKPRQQGRAARLAIGMALLLGGLACRTVMGDQVPAGQAAEVPTAAFSAMATATQAANKPIPTTTATQPSLRLTGEDLPELVLGAPGISPKDPSRPSLSGNPQTLDTEHFRVHYTLSGQDAVDTTDSDGNGHPDYVEEVARAMEYSWFAEIEHFGWAAPPPDAGLGGDDRVDVYLLEIFDEGTSGYVDSDYDAGFSGDNPNTQSVESAASSSFMALDNDYASYEYDPAPGVSRMDYMRSTAAHEFLHVIQFGYDAWEPHDWLWEATATWMQDEVFDLVNDGNEMLPSVFKSPDSCQLAYGGEARDEDADHWYGMWIFIRYLSENYGHDVIRQVWEHSVEHDGYAAWDLALATHNSDMAEVFRGFGLALLLRDFEEGHTYPVVRLEGEANTGQRFDPVNGVAQLGLDYVEVLADEAVRISLDGSGLEAHMVAIRGAEAHLFPFESAQVAVDASQFERLYVLVFNLQKAEFEHDCRFSSYSIQVLAEPGTTAIGEVHRAANFLPPQVEGFQGDEKFDSEP